MMEQQNKISENQGANSQSSKEPLAENSSQTDTISLENIDKFLEETDPEFTASLNEIVPEELGSDITIDSLALDEKNLVEEEENKKNNKYVSSRFPLIHKLLRTLFSPFDKIRLRIRTGSLKLRNEVLALILGRLRYCRDTLPELLSYIWFFCRDAGLYLKEMIRIFWQMNWREKGLYLVALVFLAGFVVLLSLNIKGRWLPSLANDYSSDLSKVANSVHSFRLEEERWLNEAFPPPHFTVLLEKVVVNLRKTVRHSNPMGAFKFYVSVDSNEAAIEIKDRQIELSDYVQRSLEELSYEEVNGPGGKTLLKSQVRHEINRFLNRGRVAEVFIEMMITKP